MRSLFAVITGTLLLFCTSFATSQNCPSTCKGYTCDEWYYYNGNTCAYEEEHYGCNCDGCECPGDSDDALSTILSIKRLDSTEYSDALCLDGSQYAYYVREGISPNFLLFFEGGGWCYDQNCPSPTSTGTVKDCEERAKGDLGSSTSWKESRSYGGMLSASISVNPNFYNWTTVYLPYCDGTSFAGNAETNGLMFKGAAILDAVVEDLKATTSIGSAPRIVISGGSAGASTVYFHIDKLADALSSPNTEVIGMPDAGFFLNLPAADDDTNFCWPDQMRSLAEISNMYPALDEDCLARFPNEEWRCMFPEYYADTIDTRFFILNSLYDSSELYYTLLLDCCPAGCSGYPTCKSGSDAMIAFEALSQQHRDAWKPLISKEGNGIWAPACIIHTMSEYEWTDTEWEVPGRSGNTISVAVAEFLANKTALYEDEVDFPDNEPCSSED